MRSIQTNAHQNHTDFTKCNFWMGGLDLTHKNIDAYYGNSYSPSMKNKQKQNTTLGASRNTKRP